MTANRFLAATLLCLSLSACQQYHHAPSFSPLAKGAAIGAATGAIVGSVTGISIPAAIAVGGIMGVAYGDSLVDYNRAPTLNGLRDFGIRVFVVGDEVTLVLPTDRTFYYRASHLSPNYLPVLHEIAQVISNYDNRGIRVTGYTDSEETPQRSLALSREQAQQVAASLWNDGLDSRLIYAMGYGDCHPVATNRHPLGRAVNRRIEISFRKFVG